MTGDRFMVSLTPKLRECPKQCVSTARRGSIPDFFPCYTSFGSSHSAASIVTIATDLFQWNLESQKGIHYYPNNALCINSRQTVHSQKHLRHHKILTIESAVLCLTCHGFINHHCSMGEVWISSRILRNKWWAVIFSISVWFSRAVCLWALLSSHWNTWEMPSALKRSNRIELADVSLSSPRRASPCLARKRTLDRIAYSIPPACSFCSLCVLLSNSAAFLVVLGNVMITSTASQWALIGLEMLLDT